MQLMQKPTGYFSLLALWSMIIMTGVLCYPRSFYSWSALTKVHHQRSRCPTDFLWPLPGKTLINFEAEMRPRLAKLGNLPRPQTSKQTRWRDGLAWARVSPKSTRRQAYYSNPIHVIAATTSPAFKLLIRLG